MAARRIPKTRKYPAFGRELVGRRKLGDRIGLLIVGVHDWSFGDEIISRDGVARVVVPEDMLPHEIDWSVAAGLDCLIGGIEEKTDERVLYAAAGELRAAGAASVWATFGDEVWRLVKNESRLFLASMGFEACDGPATFRNLGRAIARFRDLSRMGWTA